MAAVLVALLAAAGVAIRALLRRRRSAKQSQSPS
jgi:hypothetical protein